MDSIAYTAACNRLAKTMDKVNDDHEPVIIDNRAGADGIVGTQLVARATPDGYVLLFALSSHTTAPFARPATPYDPYKDFAVITEIATQPMVLLVNPGLSVTSVEQLVTLAKSAPKAISANHAGGVGQIALEMFRRRAGIANTSCPWATKAARFR